MIHTTDSINMTNTSGRSTVTDTPKKLIEVALPLEAMNRESGREKSLRHGHPSTMHLYWSRKPTATARAVLFAQLVDDPSAHPEEFPTIEAQDRERARLLKIVERLVVWENSNDESLLQEATGEIRKSNGGELPTVVDPFAGGGSIPLEAQRLGLGVESSDLNPLAVVLNLGLVGIPPKFTSRPPVFPNSAAERHIWRRAEGLAADVRSYGSWLRDEAERRVGHMFPKVIAPGGTEHTVIAWMWARTVRSPNPANPIETPLVNSWWLCKKKGKEAWVEARVQNGRAVYEVHRDANGPKGEADGTIGRKGGHAVGDGTPFSLEYVRETGRSGNMGTQLIAVIAEGERGRVYISPTADQEKASYVERPQDVPEGQIGYNPQFLLPPNYGYRNWSDLFTNRQLKVLVTLSDLVAEAREMVEKDALASGMPLGASLEDGGNGAAAYADAVATYLALAVSRQTARSSNLSIWHSGGEKIEHVFLRPALPMTWAFPESNPFSSSSGNFLGQVEWIAKVLDRVPALPRGAEVRQADAVDRSYESMVVSTDPPYYDMIGYADLSDFYYVWLRKMLSGVLTGPFGTVLTPKQAELVANRYRQDGKAGAERFFVEGFNRVFERMRQTASPNVPLTVYYAYKQQDSSADGTASTGWHTLLSGLIGAGWEITATWPMRTESSRRPRNLESNALASSIVLACRPRPVDGQAITRRALVATLKRELPAALRTLMQGTIAPVDLAQAAIGPGISVFSRYSRVREADGSDMSVKDALLVINSTLDEVLGEQESDFDPDTRFAVKWYRQYGWAQENSGIADQLARSSDTSIGALERGGIFEAKGGKARLLAPGQLDGDWDASADERVSVWEATVRLAAVMAKAGADKVAELLPSVQTRVNLDAVKELGFLLFHEAEKKKDTKDAILFNGLVSAWGDVNEQARKYASTPRSSQRAFDFDEDED